MRNRQNGVLVYLSDAEKQHLVKQTAVAGLSVGAFIRKLIIGKEIRPRPPDELPELLRQLSGIGTNINQIAKVANASGYVRKEDIQNIMEMQAALWRAVKRG